jgi:anti-anti-sigma factor
VPLLNVVLVPGPDQVVVRVTGETDLSTTPLLADALMQAGSLGTRQVVVDVAAARFWDVSGLHALVDVTADLGAAGRTCRLVGAPASTRRLIELADFASQLDLAGAVRELPARNFVASQLPIPRLRTGRSRRPAHTGASSAHGAPAAGGLVSPIRG